MTLTLCAFAPAASGRQEAGKTQADEEVVRVKAELVQTGVSVFDKQGRFVDGLKKEDFELRVDGRPVPITFFENILAGSPRDRSARAAAAGETAPPKADASAPSSRQRTIVFFLDDRHLSLDSVARARRMLLDFIDKEMGEGDLVAVASASGRIGFLQQFTDNKDVLRAAVARVGHVPYEVTDYGRNPGGTMTEYMALAIERKDDERVFDFYVEDCMKWGGAAPTRQDRASSRRHCEVQVQNRARQLLMQAGEVTASTYYSLETLLHYAEKMPGSKLAFFVSDGFLADTGPRGPVGRERLGRITDEARRAGVVIYTIDARGLVSGALDATGNTAMDPNGRLESSNLREVVASQDALNALAEDTGGRALRNQNTFGQFIDAALEETSRYYLLAWRPEAGEGQNEKLRKIEVSVAGRPDLTVRSARGFVVVAPPPAAAGASGEEKGAAKVEKKPGDPLGHALAEFYPRQSIPLQLSLIYLDVPSSGMVLTTSVQAFTEVLSYGAQDREPAQLTIEGVVLDDQGKPAASFRTGLKVNPPSAEGGARNASDVIYNQPSPLKPGIYQVRVAARDERSGIMGSAAQWVVIPDLSTRQLSLSSLIVGLEGVGDKGAAGGRIQWSVDKRFARGSRLRFMTFVYNAGAPANLSSRVQVFREGREVVATPFQKVAADAQTDPARVPFTAEIKLGELQPGRYTLRVTAEDRAANKTATQQTAFYVQ
ncbi:MAG: VWA domain-containing protein [Acidobacteria bacterium]|nr:VWA domain-containing protein [Acidobacteriota bacterium]